MEVWNIEIKSDMQYVTNLEGFSEALEPLCAAEDFLQNPALVKRTFSRIFNEGHRIKHPELVPKRVTSYHPKTARKRNSDITHLNSGAWGVSNKVRDIVEALDPDAHQFFPLDITYSDGTKPPLQYSLMNVHRKIEAVDFQRSEENGMQFKEVNSYRPYRQWTPMPGLVFRRSVVENKHLWMEPGTPRLRFASGELITAFQKAKVTGFGLRGPFPVSVAS
ncbi:MAG: DUF1629 domain-containing protein [Pseudomonadota bacterium]